jgi:phenylacetate-CoA ligase
MLFSSYHLTEKNIPYYIDELIKFQPDYIDSYPSSLFSIARYAQNHSIDLKNITAGITTSAETLLLQQREAIESIFGVPIVDQYGAAEMCVFVGQCPEGNYHIHSDYAILEFLREDGTVAEPGEEAEIICTGLINPVMPIIRYRIGDRGILSGRKCKCGNPFPVMEGLLGRTDDMIITKDGRRISRFGAVLYGLPVKEVQYIQTAINSLTIRIVIDRYYTMETEKTIEERLKKRLGEGFDMRFEYLDEISRGPGGKLKTIVSALKKGAQRL